MADSKQLSLLQQDVATWNRWKAENADVRVNLRRADLGGANLVEADLHRAVLNGAVLYNANLSGANLSGANLRAANLREANLISANLVEADLHGVVLNGAVLYNANLSRANLTDADLSGANLSGANLTDADLSGANLSHADLTDTDLTGVCVGYTTFADNDLSSVKGLETIDHRGPSSIGIDTIYRSGGNIPETFLRGAGVPDNFIEYMKSLVGTAIEYYSCFISYSTKDQEFAERLHADLQNKGVRCWFAPHDAQGGRKLEEQIDAAIRIHEKLLLILSPDSMESEWVKAEIAKARKREGQEERQVLFPVRLMPFEEIKKWKLFDADIGKDSAKEIREYYIPDFTPWKTDHDTYVKEFEKLIRDLKSGSSRPLTSP